MQIQVDLYLYITANKIMEDDDDDDLIYLTNKKINLYHLLLILFMINMFRKLK